MRVFVDAGGWYSVMGAADMHHVEGARYYRRLVTDRARIATSDFVLDEVITRLRYDAGHATACRFIEVTRQASEQGALTVLHVTGDLWTRVERIFITYRDTRLSFTDCTSFAILEQHPVDEVFGYDSHFGMRGHVLRPGPGS